MARWWPRLHRNSRMSTDSMAVKFPPGQSGGMGSVDASSATRTEAFFRASDKARSSAGNSKRSDSQSLKLGRIMTSSDIVGVLLVHRQLSGNPIVTGRIGQL